MGGIVLPSFFYKTQWDFLFIFLIFIGIVTGFAVNESKILDVSADLVDKWAIITLAIYLNHKIFRNIFVKLWPECNVWIYVLWFIFITVYSVFTTWFVNKTVEIIKRYFVEVETDKISL